jgi:hypothetical protein
MKGSLSGRQIRAIVNYHYFDDLLLMAAWDWVYDVMVDERRSWDWKKRRWIDRLVTFHMRRPDGV